MRMLIFWFKLFRYITAKLTWLNKRISMYTTKYGTFVRCYFEIKRRRGLISRIPKYENRSVNEKLKNYGFVSLTDVIGVDSVRSEYAKVTQNLDLENLNDLNSNKAHWTKFLAENTTSFDSPFVQFALQTEILSMVTEYMGECPLLESVEIIKSKGQTAPYKSSALWHKDYNDTKTVKVFIYLNDVTTSENGPFEFYDAESTSDFKLPYSPVHKPDHVLEGLDLNSSYSTVLGKAGCVFMIDTSRCYHRGSRISDPNSEFHRIAYIATFTTSYRMVYRPQKIGLGRDLNELANAVLKPLER